MNPTTTKNNSQAPTSQQFDQARYNLGFITQMHEQLLQHKGINGPKAQSQQPQTAHQTPQNAPGQAQPQETPKESSTGDIGAKLTQFELNITKQLDSMRQELKNDTQKEIEGIKNDLKTALNEDEQETTA